MHYPELISEWHPLKNDKSPNNYLPHSNLKVGGSVPKVMSGRRRYIIGTTNGNGCPRCSNQSSKNEIRIYTELKSVFDDLFHRHKIEGVEADILSPS